MPRRRYSGWVYMFIMYAFLPLDLTHVDVARQSVRGAEHLDAGARQYANVGERSAFVCQIHISTFVAFSRTSRPMNIDARRLKPSGSSLT